MTDLTLLYYSAHSLPENCEANVRKELTREYPIVSVTQKPIDLGLNICVGNIGKSHYNCYKQILIGLREVKTEYVAMSEDDTLYPKEHYGYRPKTIAFNRSMWFLEDRIFWHKGWTGMFACIAKTEALRQVLEQRFKETPEEPFPRRSQRHTWKEPEGDYFETKIPLITLNYFAGLDGKKKSVTNKPAEATILPFWGEANKLFDKLWKH